MLDNNTGVLLSLSVIMSLPPVAPCYRCIMLLLHSQIIICLILFYAIYIFSLIVILFILYFIVSHNLIILLILYYIDY